VQRIIMPIYEYECQKCKTKFEMSGTFEMLISLKPQCPNCKGNKVKKLISIPFVHYNGKGFYNTDKDG
jgi:putative FmdB family regulatory protein